MGVTFTDVYSASLCSPSRYMLLSSNYPYRGRVPASNWKIGKHEN